MKKQRAILLMILAVVVFAALFFMSQDIISQSRELISLRQRVINLELIINYEMNIKANAENEQKNGSDIIG